MGEGKKMALVPLGMFHRMNKPNLTALKNPNQDQLVKTLGEISTVLHDNNLPDDVKSSRFNEKIYADKITTSAVAATAITKNPHIKRFIVYRKHSYNLLIFC